MYQGEEEVPLVGGGDGTNSGGRPSLVQKVKHSIFMLLYLVSKNQLTPHWLLSANQIITALQLTYSALATQRFTWHTSLTNALVPLLSWLSMDSVLKVDLVPIGVAASAALVILVFLVSVHICVSFVLTDSVEYLWTLPLLQIALRLMTSVLFIPILNMLMAVYQARPGTLGTYLPPGTPAATWAMVGATVLIVVFVSFFF